MRPTRCSTNKSLKTNSVSSDVLLDRAAQRLVDIVLGRGQSLVLIEGEGEQWGLGQNRQVGARGMHGRAPVRPFLPQLNLVATVLGPIAGHDTFLRD